MENFESFLHPERKPRLRFRLASFKDEFEMRQLSGEEDKEIIRAVREEVEAGKSVAVPILRYVAESLTIPDLRNVDFQNALSEKCGKKILSPVDALLALVNGPELDALIKVYSDYSEMAVSFSDEVEQAKN